MATFHRRRFIKAGALGAIGSAWWAGAADAGQSPPPAPQPHFVGDGLQLSVHDYTQLLDKLAAAGKLDRDVYLSGGVVKQLETKFAQLLGKEEALFIPTGTLANHLAIRNLAQGNSRVIVQAESHIYCDSLDCVQTLSHLNLIPLAPGKATIPLAEIEATCQKSVNGPFPTPVGAISIECPVRRQNGAVFDFDEMKRVAAYAKKNNIKMHLDGARLYLASAYTGVSPAEYATLFDTVYISLYKYFNAGTGAILAGSKAVIERVAHDRKIFGSGLYQAWPYAAVALHYLEGFPERFAQAVETANKLFALLEKQGQFKVEHQPQGTNIYRLRVNGIDPAQYQKALAQRGIRVGRVSPTFPGIQLLINESLNYSNAEELAKVFVEALGK